jgi:hypothetical protein
MCPEKTLRGSFRNLSTPFDFSEANVGRVKRQLWVAHSLRFFVMAVPELDPGTDQGKPGPERSPLTAFDPLRTSPVNRERAETLRKLP